MADTYQPVPAAAQAMGITGYVVREPDGAWVPCDLSNIDYQAFLAWMAEGNPAPAGWTGPTNTSPATG